MDYRGGTKDLGIFKIPTEILSVLYIVNNAVMFVYMCYLRKVMEVKYI